MLLILLRILVQVGMEPGVYAAVLQQQFFCWRRDTDDYTNIGGPGGSAGVLPLRNSMTC